MGYNKSQLHTFIDLSLHSLSAVIGSVIIYRTFKGLAYVPVFILGSIFIDLDHLLDYFAHFKKAFDLKLFLATDYRVSKKIYVVLHSWELAIMLWLAGTMTGQTWPVVLSAGMVTHLVIDTIMRRKLFVYFLAYRIANRFDTKIFLHD